MYKATFKISKFEPETIIFKREKDSKNNFYFKASEKPKIIFKVTSDLKLETEN